MKKKLLGGLILLVAIFSITFTVYSQQKNTPVEEDSTTVIDPVDKRIPLGELIVNDPYYD